MAVQTFLAPEYVSLAGLGVHISKPVGLLWPAISMEPRPGRPVDASRNCPLDCRAWLPPGGNTFEGWATTPSDLAASDRPCPSQKAKEYYEAVAARDSNLVRSWDAALGA
eukprot:358229-Chlamydomonas_euryale.AAC.2